MLRNEYYSIMNQVAHNEPGYAVKSLTKIRFISTHFSDFSFNLPELSQPCTFHRESLSEQKLKWLKYKHSNYKPDSWAAEHLQVYHTHSINIISQFDIFLPEPAETIPYSSFKHQKETQFKDVLQETYQEILPIFIIRYIIKKHIRFSCKRN